MKHILKYLTIAGVLILFLPFLKCNGDMAQKDDSSINVANIDTISENGKLNNHYNNGMPHTNNIDSLNTSNYSHKTQDLTSSILIQDDSLTGIGLSYLSLIFLFPGSIHIISIALLFLSLILTNSLVLVILSFTRKIKPLIILAITNIIMLIISYTILETHLNQILYGSYLFVINSLLIIYFATKYKKLKQSIIPQPVGGG